MNFELIKTISHDINAYTQGYFFKDGFLYESTGLYGKSSLRKISTEGGSIIKNINIEKKYFSEGIEYYKNNIYMLTWREQVCKVFDFNNFQEIKSFQYSGEGWGISLFKSKFYMSNGSNTIKVLDPENFNTLEEFNVFDENKNPIKWLNELQVVDNFLLANIWFTDKIVVIDIENKKFIKTIDFSSLRVYLKNKNAEVMNGIAYDEKEKIFYITGKFWDLSFKTKIYF